MSDKNQEKSKDEERFENSENSDSVRDYYSNYIGVFEPDATNVIDFIPKYFLQKEPVFTKHFTSPTALIILEDHGKYNALIYRKKLLRFTRDNQRFRYGNLPSEFNNLVTAMLKHYNELKFFDYAVTLTEDIPISKSLACFYLSGKRYLIPLSYEGDDISKKKDIAGLREKFTRIFREMAMVLGDKAEAHFHNLDVDNMNAEFQKRFKKWQEKEDKLYDADFDF